MAIGRIPEPGTGIPESIIAAKGDIIVGTANDTPAVLSVGTNTYTLVANSATATGLEWQAPAGGGGMTLISEQTASASTSINFTSIAGTYKQLLLIFSGLYHSANGEQFTVRFNNSSATEYSTSSYSSNGFANNTATNVRPNQPFVGEDVTATTPAGLIRGQLLIDNYSSATKFKYYSGCSGYSQSHGGVLFQPFAGFWNNTAAITSVDIVRVGTAATLTNVANTSIRLYGLS